MLRKRIFHIIQIGDKQDLLSKFFDFFIVFAILLNLGVVIYDTFDSSIQYQSMLNTIELITQIIFVIEYILRLWTTDLLYPEESRGRSLLHFIFSFYGLVDLFTFLPYFLPFMFPAGIVAFRMLRVIRIFRLFKINQQYDAFNVIMDVLIDKKNQIFSSVCMIFVMMIAASLCMYSLEHEAQPEVFSNAFSGLWWSVSTILTVGYGDIYPITTAGQIMAILLAFLGVGLVAIPTGIISAGFVEQYTKIKNLAEYQEETNVSFLTLAVDQRSSWCNQLIRHLNLPKGLLLIAIRRNQDVIIPNGDTKIIKGDKLILCAESVHQRDQIHLTEIRIKGKSEWIGKPIRDLDISRQSIIVMIRRKGHAIIPHGEDIIQLNDLVILYEKGKQHLQH